MWKDFVCSMHCALKSVTFSVYNNTDLNFNMLFCCDYCHCELHWTFTANSVKEQRIIFFEIFLERRDKFSDTTRDTRKTGKRFETLLTSLNFYSYWVGSYQVYWTGKLPESRNFQSASISSMQPMCITGQRKLLLTALESSTSSWW